MMTFYSLYISKQATENDLQEKSVIEEQQKLLLDKLSRSLEEKEEQVSMATEENVGELSEMRNKMEKYRSEVNVVLFHIIGDLTLNKNWHLHA